MDAQTFTVKTPRITDGRSHMPLVRTDVLMSGLNYYAPGPEEQASYAPGRGSHVRCARRAGDVLRQGREGYGAGEGRRHPSAGRALLPVRELRRHAVGAAAASPPTRPTGKTSGESTPRGRTPARMTRWITYASTATPSTDRSGRSPDWGHGLAASRQRPDYLYGRVLRPARTLLISLSLTRDATRMRHGGRISSSGVTQIRSVSIG